MRWPARFFKMFTVSRRARLPRAFRRALVYSILGAVSGQHHHIFNLVPGRRTLNCIPTHVLPMLGVGRESKRSAPSRSLLFQYLTYHLLLAEIAIFQADFLQTPGSSPRFLILSGYGWPSQKASFLSFIHRPHMNSNSSYHRWVHTDSLSPPMSMLYIFFFITITFQCGETSDNLNKFISSVFQARAFSFFHYSIWLLFSVVIAAKYIQRFHGTKSLTHSPAVLFI